MNSYFLNISGSWILLILLCMSAVAFSIFTYRNTTPLISRDRKIILVSLRSVALLIILFALFEPIYTIINTFEKPPHLVVLLDNSRSLAIPDASGERESRYKKLLSSINFDKFGENILFYKFDKHAIAIENFIVDSLKLNGQLTDISEAIRTSSANAEEKNICSMLLITDGAFNTGNNPIFDAENFAKPIYTIGVGDTVAPKDISLSSVVTNEIAYIENPIPVTVNFNSTGFNDNIIKIILLDNDKKVAEQEIKLNSERENYTILFEYNPLVEGTRKLTATINKLDGEITDKNNSASQYVKILKNKRTVAMFSGYPSPDFAFIKRALKLKKGVEVLEYVQKEGEEFYTTPTQQQISSADMYIFCGFPISSTPNTILSQINNELNKNKPLMFVAGLTTDYNKLKLLQENLPFVLVSSRQQEFVVTPDINTEALSNPLLRITGTDEDIKMWNSLPPLFRTETFLRVKPEAEVVATMKVNNIALKDPLIITKDLQGKKSVAILAYGLYRWKLLGFANEVSKGAAKEDLFEILVDNSFKWLSVHEKNKQINIRTTKKHYTQSEKVEFIGEVYDAAFVPLENAVVNVNISTDGGARSEPDRQLLLTSIGNGRYYGLVEGLAQGEYKFTADVTLGSRKFGSDGGRFSIGELSVEYQNLKQNAELLKTISSRTNGKYYNSTDVSLLIEEITRNKKFVSKPVVLRSEFHLWNWYWLLSVAIFFLAVEWFLRKRFGLL